MLELKKARMEAWMTVDGKRLQEYVFTKKKNILQCTVEMLPGKTFGVHWKDLSRNRLCHLASRVIVGDVSERGEFIKRRRSRNPNDASDECGEMLGFEHFREEGDQDPTPVFRPFVFPKPDEQARPDDGTIRVLIFRGNGEFKRLRRGDDGSRPCPNDRHVVDFGPSTRGDPKTVYADLDHADDPLIEFCFIFKTRDVLQREGIISAQATAIVCNNGETRPVHPPEESPNLPHGECRPAVLTSSIAVPGSRPPLDSLRLALRGLYTASNVSPPSGVPAHRSLDSAKAPAQSGHQCAVPPVSALDSVPAARLPLESSSSTRDKESSTNDNSISPKPRSTSRSGPPNRGGKLASTSTSCWEVQGVLHASGLPSTLPDAQLPSQNLTPHRNGSPANPNIDIKTFGRKIALNVVLTPCPETKEFMDQSIGILRDLLENETKRAHAEDRSVQLDMELAEEILRSTIVQSHPLREDARALFEAYFGGEPHRMHRVDVALHLLHNPIPGSDGLHTLAVELVRAYLRAGARLAAKDVALVQEHCSIAERVIRGPLSSTHGLKLYATLLLEKCPRMAFRLLVENPPPGSAYSTDRLVDSIEHRLRKASQLFAEDEAGMFAHIELARHIVESVLPQSHRLKEAAIKFYGEHKRRQSSPLTAIDGSPSPPAKALRRPAAPLDEPNRAAKRRKLRKQASSAASSRIPEGAEIIDLTDFSLT